MTRHALCANLPYVSTEKSTDGRGDGTAEARAFAGSASARVVTRNLLTPWVLLLLKQWSAHGYFLLQTLQRMGFPRVDHTALYKELRNLEKGGYVTSNWETDGSGPAKRTYRITPLGEDFLRSWAEAVAGYERMISSFFDLYMQLFGMVPKPGDPPGDPTETPSTESKGAETQKRRG